MLQNTTPLPTMDVAEAATLLGWSKPWFARQRRQLERNHGLPARLPGRRYSRAAFMRWLETYAERAEQARTTAGQPVRITFDRQQLEARYAGARA
ncbi:hypothetical protein [Rhizobium sp. SGZ-381]|uniref:hypothetical protein n=1 Tax=Rhizobium sp. SGZ-381 TaxID=3342800 RepID=UPI00366D9D9D